MKYLSLDERKMIEKMKRSNNSNRNIASVLRRSHTTIDYEINYNKNISGQYDAEYAHYKFLGNKYTKKYLLKDKITSKNIKYVRIIIIVIILGIYGYFLYGAMYESSYPCKYGPNSITIEVKVLSPKEIELNDLKQNNPIIVENMVIKQGETDDKIVIIADKKIPDMILLFYGTPRCMGSSMGSFMGYDNLENIRTAVWQKNRGVVQKGRGIIKYKVDSQNGNDQIYQLRTMWGWGMYKDERELEIIWVDRLDDFVGGKDGKIE